MYIENKVERGRKISINRKKIGFQRKLLLRTKRYYCNLLKSNDVFASKKIHFARLYMGPDDTRHQYKYLPSSNIENFPFSPLDTLDTFCRRLNFWNTFFVTVGTRVMSIYKYIINCLPRFFQHLNTYIYVEMCFFLLQVYKTISSKFTRL